MVDASFAVPAEEALAHRPAAGADPLTGQPQKIPVLDRQTKFDCGGACAFATMGDYLRFGQMLVDGGTLDGRRMLSPQMVAQMTTDHLGADIKKHGGSVPSRTAKATASAWAWR